MNELDKLITAQLLIKTISFFVGAVTTVLFIQSGWNKISERDGNMTWLKGYFAESPFKNIVPLLLTLITVFELIAGISSLVGLFCLVFCESVFFSILGLAFGLLTFLCLFTGMRLAKDYPSAAALVPYMIFCSGGLLLFAFLS